MRSRTIARAAAALAAGILAVALSGCAAVASESAAADAHAASTRQTASRVIAVAIGDSISHGRGVLPAQAWPERVAASHGWELTDVAINGSGFVKQGFGGFTYETQITTALALHPQLVFIAATRNDLSVDDRTLRTRTVDLLDRIRSVLPKATIVGTSAVWGADAPPARLAGVDDAVRQAVTGVGGTFIDVGFPLSGHPELVQPDTIHPTASGQAIIAQTVDRRLTAVRLTVG